MASRRVTALALGVVLATLLLGGGWLRATLRDRDARMSDARGQLERRADLVRAAVDESLEELRAREDERPFYLYNHFYSPPEVLAISDPVARSPLSREPTDVRLVGHFQIDSEGAVQTPYDPDASEPSPLGQQIAEAVQGPQLGPLRALATGEGPSLLQPGLTASPPTTPEANAPTERPGEGRGRQRDSDARRSAQSRPAGQTGRFEQAAPELEPERQAPDPTVEGRRNQALGEQVPSVEEASVDEAVEQPDIEDPSVEPPGIEQPIVEAPSLEDPTPAQEPVIDEAPLTVGLNAWSNAQARDIVAAQSGDIGANNRLLERGRQVPRISRRNVGWEGGEDRANTGGRGLSRVPTDRDARAQRPEPVALRRPRRRPTNRPADPLPVVDNSGDGVGAAVGLDNLVQREAEVTYTSMIYRDEDGVLVLHRLVTHEGVSVVQGLLFDRARLVASWIPALVARHADEGAALTVVTDNEGTCAVRRPASRILSGVDLCIGPSALTAVSARLDEELRYQVGGLAGLWLLVLLAAFAIVAAARRAEMLSRQKSAFVSAVSHELRTPLTTLRMHAEMLEGELVSEARRPKVHRELVRESVRLARLVENVLSLSKLEEGRRTLRLEEADLAAHVRDVVEGQRGFIEEKGFTLTLDLPETLRATFDAQAVEQIVVNLTDNALKYAAHDPKEIDVVLEDVGGARLSVSDRGPGIPEEERDRVFERFHRVERPEHAHAPGTGIGLSLVAELAEAHGGKATAHAREGGGLELRVTLG